MQKIENNTDRLFREKLLNHQVVPPSAVWDNIAGSLDGNKRKRRMIFIWGVSLAASLLLAFLAGWYFSGQTSLHDAMQAENHTHVSNVPVQPIPTQQSTINSIASTSTKQLPGSVFSAPIVESSSKLASSTAAELDADNITAHENFFIRLLSPLKPSVKSNHTNNYEMIAMNSVEELSDADRAIIARNIENNKESSKIGNHSLWAVGVQASPVYRFDKASSVNNQNSDPLLIQSNGGNSNYVTNITGGIKVELNTTSRLSVQSGVNYGEINQNPVKVGVSFDGQNWIKDQLGTDGTKGFVSNPANGNSISNSMILNTRMGIANIDMPQGVGLATNEVTKINSSEVARNYSVIQQAGYLEIPLMVRYKIIDQRVGFLILGGINTNVLMSNNVSLIDKKQVIANGKTEGLNPLTFSSSVGMGVNYAITDRFNLSLEPTMKIQLNSLNRQTNYNSRPYAVGIFTGITYQF